MDTKLEIKPITTTPTTPPSTASFSTARTVSPDSSDSSDFHAELSGLRPAARLYNDLTASFQQAAERGRQYLANRPTQKIPTLEETKQGVRPQFEYPFQEKLARGGEEVFKAVNLPGSQLIEPGLKKIGAPTGVAVTAGFLGDIFNPLIGGKVKRAEEVPTALSKINNTLKQGSDFIQSSKSKDFGGKGKELMTQLYDRFQPISRFVSEAENSLGRKLTLDENAYIGARLYAGVGGKISDNLRDLGNIIKESGSDVKQNDLSTYLFAERAIERAKRGFKNPGNIDEPTAQQAISELRGQLGDDAFKALQTTAARVYNYGDQLLQKTRDAGIISRESYNAIKAKNQMYVPFDVVEHIIDQEGIVPTGRKAFSVAEQNLIKTTKGTTKDIDDPLNALVRKTIRTVDLIERNGVAQKVARMGKQLGEGNNLVVPVKEGQFVPKDFEKISYFENGIKNSMAVPKEVGESLKRMTAKQADVFTHMASYGARALRAGATSLNAIFIVPNAFRDFETATLVSKYGFNVADWGRGFWESAKATLREYGVPVNDSIYREYLRNAGQIGGYYSTYLNDIPRTVSELTGKGFWGSLRNLLNPLTLLDKTVGEVGRIIERTPRLGVFTKALSRGETPTAAGFLSREATVDFAKMGESMKLFNMWVPFVNARLQAEVNIGKSLIQARKDPKRLAALSAKIAGLAITPFVATYYNNTLRWPDVWDDIADYEKANNIILIYGNHKDEDGRYTQILKFPKGDWNYFVDPIQDFLEWSRGNQPSLFHTLATDSLLDFLPISTSPQPSLGKALTQGATGLLPPPIKAGIESITNQNFYTGRNIVPQSLEKASPEQQYKERTPLLAKKVGEYLNISPLKVENAIGTTFGGLGRQIIGIGGRVGKPGFTPPTSFIENRFKGATGGQKEQQEGLGLGKYETQMYDRKAMEKRAAQGTWNALKNATSDEEVVNILKTIGENEGAKDKLREIIKDEALGTTYTDERIKALSPKERASYILDNLNSFKTDEEAMAFLTRLKINDAITDDTRDEMRKILESQTTH